MSIVDDVLGYRAPSASAAHLRCPVCGMLRPLDRFDQERVASHELERAERHAVGGRIGFEWDRGLPLEAGDLELLQADLLLALRRVRDEASRVGARILGDDDVDE